MVNIQRVATAGPVLIIALLIEPVVAGIVDAAHGDRRANLIQFGGVVEHHIQHHFDTRSMQAFDRLLKLLQRHYARLTGGVTGIHRPERKGIVAPVVAEAELQQSRFAGEMGHRQQLKRGNPQLAQVIHHNRMTQRRVSPAQRFRNFRMLLRQAAHMGFINYRVAPRYARCDIALPVKIFGYYHTFRRNRGVVMRIGLRFAALKQRVIRNIAFHCAGAGINQQLCRVKAMSPLRRPGAINPVAVALSRF